MYKQLYKYINSSANKQIDISINEQTDKIHK